METSSHLPEHLPVSPFEPPATAALCHEPGWEADDDAHWPRRIGLRPSEARHGGQRDSARRQMQKISAGKFHFVLNVCNSFNLHCLPALNGATCALGNFPQCLTARSALTARALPTLHHHTRVRLACGRRIRTRACCAEISLEGDRELVHQPVRRWWPRTSAQVRCKAASGTPQFR